MQKTSSTYVLIDAGLAVDLEGEALSLPGSVPGTQAYYSPEQVTGPSRDLDVRSDLFSLGIVLYECATGEHPFINDAMPRVSVTQNIVTLDPPHPHAYVASLPNELCTLILRLLAKDRSLRYESAEVLLAEVGAGIQGIVR